MLKLFKSPDIRKEIIDLLTNNGFVKTDADLYGNDYCAVLVNQEGLTVVDSLGQSDHLALWDKYWLVGVLILNGYINGFKK